MTMGRMEPLEHGHRSRFRRGRRTFQRLRAGRSSGRTKPEYTAASGRHDHASFRELADASVRCPGLGARLAVGTHYGPTGIHWADYSPRNRRDGSAGTTMLYHLHIDSLAHSLSVMTTGRQELLEHGHRRRFRRGRRSGRTFQGLLVGQSSCQRAD